MSTIGRGGTITLDATFTDGAGTLVDPTTPLLDVLNPSSVQVLTDAVPIRDSLGYYHYDYAVDAAAPLGAWTAHWTGTINGAAVNDDDAFTVVLAGQVAFDASVFATTVDVAARLGRTLTAAEEDQAEIVIEVVTGLIQVAVHRDSAWAAGLSPIPAVLRLLCIEKAVSAIANPFNVASSSETLGAHSYAATFPRAADIGVFLSDAEERQARFAVYGVGSASARAASVVDDILDYADDGEINESWGS